MVCLLMDLYLNVFCLHQIVIRPFSHYTDYEELNESVNVN